MYKKYWLLLIFFGLWGCARDLTYVDSKLSDKGYGIAFVEILLEGRETATVFVGNDLIANLRLTLKKGAHVYAVPVNEGKYQFQSLRFELNGFFHDFASGKRDYPLMNKSLKKRAFSNKYCSSWDVVPGNILVLGKISFIIDDDDLYLKCDERDSTRYDVRKKSQKIFPMTFRSVDGDEE